MQRTHFENGRNAFPDEANRGMTLRDYFAAQAMPALVVNFLSKDLDSIDPEGWMDGLAMDAYSVADAMLKRREE